MDQAVEKNNRVKETRRDRETATEESEIKGQEIDPDRGERKAELQRSQEAARDQNDEPNEEQKGNTRREKPRARRVHVANQSEPAVSKEHEPKDREHKSGDR
jgi:hypothetical protein